MNREEWNIRVRKYIWRENIDKKLHECGEIPNFHHIGDVVDYKKQRTTHKHNGTEYEYKWHKKPLEYYSLLYMIITYIKKTGLTILFLRNWLIIK